jgi:O-antigen/teichoic acid export membrane protein
LPGLNPSLNNDQLTENIYSGMPMKVVRSLKNWISYYSNNLLVKRLFAVLSIDILVKLAGVILLPVYLRLMTQDEYGLYGYLLSIIFTFSLVLNFGLYIPLSKFYHDFETEEEKGRLLFTIFCLLAVILIGVILPIYFFNWDYILVKILFKNQINYAEYRGSVLLALVVSIGNFMLTNFLFTSEKIKQLKQYNFLRVICINFFAVFLLFMLKNQDKVRVRLETTYLVEAILLLCFSYIFIREIHKKFSRKIATAGLKLAIPVMLSAVFGIVINFSDKFFLEKYGSFSEMSYYYLAVSCAGVIPMIFTSFQNAWLPLFLKEKDLRKNVAKTNKLIIRLFVIFAILSCLIQIFVWAVLSLGIIQSKYHETLYILPLLLTSQIFSALTPLYANYLVYFEKTYLISITGFFICCLSLGLSLMLIPRWGVYGAGAVSIASNGSYFIVYYLVMRFYIQKKIDLIPVIE